MTEVPAFPLFDVDDVDIVFGLTGDRYLDRQTGSRMEKALRAEAECASRLFFNGGKLSDFGFDVRPDTDRRKVHRAIQAMLSSFAPAHEQKIGTVAVAIHHWCSPVPTPNPVEEGGV